MYKPNLTDGDPSAESLATRLRALPQPAVPPDLERRLLANIPAAAKSSPQHRGIAAVFGLAAAACLVAAVVHFVALYGGEKHQLTEVKSTHDGGQFRTSKSGNSGRLVSRAVAAEFPDGLGPPMFAWPLAGISLPASSCSNRAISFE